MTEQSRRTIRIRKTLLPWQIAGHRALGEYLGQIRVYHDDIAYREWVSYLRDTGQGSHAYSDIQRSEGAGYLVNTTKPRDYQSIKVPHAPYLETIASLKDIDGKPVQPLNLQQLHCLANGCCRSDIDLFDLVDGKEQLLGKVAFKAAAERCGLTEYDVIKGRDGYLFGDRFSQFLSLFDEVDQLGLLDYVSSTLYRAAILDYIKSVQVFLDIDYDKDGLARFIQEQAGKTHAKQFTSILDEVITPVTALDVSEEMQRLDYPVAWWQVAEALLPGLNTYDLRRQ